MDLKAPLLAFVLFVAVTYATSVNYGWTPGQEYVYKVKSRLVSGQPELKQQYAGLELKHKLIVHVKQTDLLVIKVTETNVGELNEAILGEWWNTRIPETSNLQSETKRMLETPFVVKMKNGQVEYIKVEDSEVHFIRNFKKALISSLQLDNLAINPNSLSRVDNKIVKVMEETILGECEVVYEKHLMPEHVTEVHEERVPLVEACRDTPVWEVTKTVNFTNCKTLPVYNTITPKGLYNCLPGDNACKLYWKRTYQARFVLCGGFERGLIQNVDAEEEFIVNPFGYKSESLVGGTIFNMTLRDIRPITSRVMHVPQNLMTIQSLEMRNPIFRHQQREGENYWTRSRDDFEYSRLNKFDRELINNEEDEISTSTFGRRSYPSIYDNSEIYSRKYDDESRRFARSIDSEEDFEGKTTFGSAFDDSEKYPTNYYGKNRFGKSYVNNYWSRVFNPRRSSMFESEDLIDTPYTSTSRFGKLDRMDKITPLSGMYPYPSLTKPLLFVHPKRINFQELINTIPELVQEIALNLEHPSTLAQKNVLDKIVSCAAKLELLSLEQLHKVYEKTMIFAQRQTTSTRSENEYQIKKTIKNVFFDCLAMSGTNPAIVLIKQLIKKEEIRGEQAAQLIMTIPKYCKTPTKELIDEIFDLATSVSGEHKEQIKTTALLAFSQLVNQACVSPRSQFTRYPVEIFGKFCHQDSPLINKYISYLANKLQNTQSEYKKTVYIHALGNIGHKNIIPALKPIISNTIKSSADVRSKAVQALKKLVEPQSFYRKHNRQLVKHVAQYLVSVVLDPTINYQVRMAAWEVFTICDAPLVYWQKIAMRTWFEPSTQVVAYIRSTLKSFAKIETKIPHFLNLIKKSKQVLPLCKPVKEGIQYSYNSIVSHFMREMELGYIQQISTYGAKDSIIPETIKYKAIHELGGFNFQPLEVVLKTRNIREVVQKLLHQHVFFPLSHEGGYSQQLNKIKEVLNVEPRHAKGPLEGSLFVKIAEEIQRIFPVNHESLTDIIRKIIQEYPRLESGIPINYQKAVELSDMTVVLPTQLGVPYILKIRTPALISLKGHIKIQTVPEIRSQIGVPEKVKIVFDLSPVYTWKHIATTGFTTYSDLKTYATGVEKKFTFHLPGAIVLHADLKEKQIAITHVLPETHKVQNPTDVEIMTYKVKPFTTIYNLKNLASITHTDKLKTIKVTEEPKKVNKHVGYKYLGLAGKLEQLTDGETEDFNDILKKIWLHRPTTLFHFWSASISNKQRKYRLTLDLQQSQTKETTILFDFDKIVKSVASLENSEIVSGRSFSINDNEEIDSTSRRMHSGKPFFPRTSIYETSEENIDNTERFHGLKSEYTLDSEDEYFTPSGRRHFIPTTTTNMLTRFEGRHQTEMERIVVDKVLSQLTSGYVYKVKVALLLRGTEKRDFAANLIVAMNPSNTIKKFQILLERSPLSHYERNSFKVLLDAETKFPYVPLADFAAAQGMDMTSFLKAKIFAGHNIERESQIRIEGVMKRNEEVQHYLQSLKKVAECEKNQQKGFHLHPTCVNATTVASMLNEYHFNIEYRNVPTELRNMTYHIEELVKAIWYPYMSTNHVVEMKNEHNKIQIFAKVHPIQKNFDLKIKKPTATVVFNKVPLDIQKQTVFPIYAKKSIVARTFNKVLGGYYNTKCLMGKNKIATFDKVVYDAKMKSEAFHLLTKDCSGLYKFAVLVKKHDTKKVVRVIVKNTIVQTMPSSSRMITSNGLRVIVNGRDQVLPIDKIVEIREQGKVVIRLIARPNGVVEIRAPKHGFVVLTNGEQVITKMSNFLRGSLCGLCGDFNGEKTADLKTPEKCVESPRHPYDFIRSYAIESTSSDKYTNDYYRKYETESEELDTPRRSSSYLSHYFGTPVSYLSSVFGYNSRKYNEDKYDNEYNYGSEYNMDKDEINFARRSHYSRNQCVRELDDASRVGKQWRQESGLIGGGDHDYVRNWENKNTWYSNDDEDITSVGHRNRYDDESIYNTNDLFENQWLNRENRRRFLDEDDFETEENYYKNYDSSLFSHDSLFRNDFAGREFGNWENNYESNDSYDKEWEIEGLHSYNPIYERESYLNERRFNRPSFDQETSDEEMTLSTRRHFNPIYSERKYDQEFDSDILNKDFESKKYYDNESEEEELEKEGDYERRNIYNKYNSNIDSEETNEESFEENKFDAVTPFGFKSNKKSCTILKHVEVERNGKKCFSIKPRITCNKHQLENCRPVERISKEVKFYCAQTPLEARYLENKVREQTVVPQLLRKPIHFVEQIELPTECTHIRSY